MIQGETGITNGTVVIKLVKIFPQEVCCPDSLNDKIEHSGNRWFKKGDSNL